MSAVGAAWGSREVQVSEPLYSHSRLSNFENCPKKFHYRYVLRIPSEFESIEGFVGKRVHEVLERLYLAVRKGSVPPLAKDGYPRLRKNIGPSLPSSMTIGISWMLTTFLSTKRRSAITLCQTSAS